jgi:hypothetical protein
LTELPDGIVRLCGRGEGTDNRTVVPLINDIDAPFFHRSASSSDKLARVQCSKFAAKSPVTPNKPQDERRRLYAALGRARVPGWLQPAAKTKPQLVSKPNRYHRDHEGNRGDPANKTSHRTVNRAGQWSN